MATLTHTSLPKSFASGNVREWLTRFDICSDANGWDEKVKALKLPTLLEGEALVTWLDQRRRKNYNGIADHLNHIFFFMCFMTFILFNGLLMCVILRFLLLWSSTSGT